MYIMLQAIAYEASSILLPSAGGKWLVQIIEPVSSALNSNSILQLY